MTRECRSCGEKKGKKEYSNKGWRDSECKECRTKLVKEIETPKITPSLPLPSLSLDTWEIVERIKYTDHSILKEISIDLPYFDYLGDEWRRWKIR